MPVRIGKHFASNAVGYLALFVALGGTAWAATALPAHSVGTKQLKDGAVTFPKIAITARSALAHEIIPTGGSSTSGAAGAAGAQGPAGPAGPAGPRGSTGPTGPTGAAGTNGTNGSNGAAGTNGTNGTNGSNGATGATGATGPAGLAATALRYSAAPSLALPAPTTTIASNVDGYTIKAQCVESNGPVFVASLVVNGPAGTYDGFYTPESDDSGSSSNSALSGGLSANTDTSIVSASSTPGAFERVGAEFFIAPNTPGTNVIAISLNMVANGDSGEAGCTVDGIAVPAT
jgi:hypothetical protein